MWTPVCERQTWATLGDLLRVSRLACFAQESAATFLCGSRDADEVAFRVGEMADDQGAAGRPFRPHRPDSAEPLSLPQRRLNVRHADVEQNVARL
jgi:hypothetical protein